MPKPLRIDTKLMGKGLRISTIEVPSSLRNSLGYAFETLVLHRTTRGLAWEWRRYQTREDAKVGHKALVDTWKVKSRQDVRDFLHFLDRETS